MFTKSILVLVLSLMSSIALAQATAIPTDAQVTAEKVACDTKYNPANVATSLKVSVALAQELCKGQVDMRVLEAKAKAAGSKNDKIEAELAHQRVMLDTISKSLKALESAPKVESKPAATVQPPQPQVAMPPAMMGAPFQTIDPPGNYTAATWNMFGGSPFYVEVHSISDGAQKWFIRSGGMQRVIVKKNGQTIAVAHKGPPPTGVRFEEFYADMNGDKKADTVPVRGFDPNGIDTIYVGYQPGDTIELVYLVPVTTVAVSGIPPQIVWGNPKRLVFHENSVSLHTGRPRISGRTGDPIH